MSKILRLAFIAALIMVAACSKGPDVSGDPKKMLESYIEKSFSIRSVDDRKDLAQYLSGETQRKLLAWSDDQFRLAFIETKRVFQKLLVREIKKLSAAEVSITYELVYLDQNRGKDAKVTSKKLASLLLQDSKWTISEVKNIKEVVEYRNEMSLP
ncbi:MAG: hypothetical protein JNL01_11090 [Bdellovibrionales bacterium]|nr:hypothetical protein [Bdellovibrionales bacterium]